MACRTFAFPLSSRFAALALMIVIFPASRAVEGQSTTAGALSGTVTDGQERALRGHHHQPEQHDA
jgi:hypothetical protein